MGSGYETGALTDDQLAGFAAAYDEEPLFRAAGNAVAEVAADKVALNRKVIFETDSTFSLHLDDWSLEDVTPLAPADFDSDYDVDTDDFESFQACSTGPAIAYDPSQPPEHCALVPDGQGLVPADLDRDGDVDQSDFGLFQRCFSGPGELADADCAT